MASSSVVVRSPPPKRPFGDIAFTARSNGAASATTARIRSTSVRSATAPRPGNAAAVASDRATPDGVPALRDQVLGDHTTEAAGTENEQSRHACECTYADPREARDEHHRGGRRRPARPRSARARPSRRWTRAASASPQPRPAAMRAAIVAPRRGQMPASAAAGRASSMAHWPSSAAPTSPAATSGAHGSSEPLPSASPAAYAPAASATAHTTPPSQRARIAAASAAHATTAATVHLDLPAAGCRGRVRGDAPRPRRPRPAPLDAHGSGVSPHLLKLRQHLVHRPAVPPLGHRHTHRPESRRDLLALEPPQPVGQLSQLAGRRGDERQRRDVDHREVDAARPQVGQRRAACAGRSAARARPRARAAAACAPGCTATSRHA